MIVLVVPGILQIPAAIVRGTERGGTWQTTLVSVIIVCVICAPYVWFTLIKHEEATTGAWWSSRLLSDQSQDDGQQE